MRVLLVTAEDTDARSRAELPWRFLDNAEKLNPTAESVAHDALGAAPAWIEQVRAYGGQRHPGASDVSLAYAGLVSANRGEGGGAEGRGGGGIAAKGGEWRPVERLPPLATRQRAMVNDALVMLRDRIEIAPVAFHLLPRAFTLSQLQEVYELLLGRALHKASFRRALQGARLVRPLDEWRSAGRGRPARLYRFAPARRHGGKRSARFDVLKT
ncbi:MAG: hypothetical protein M3373_00035 [Gemmatimonadota bacterium]|nr:hypothetical protein [Gemmatimonadota bacterium]